MIKRFFSAAALALVPLGLSLAPAGLYGQAAPAVRVVPSMTAGGYYSNFRPDYTPGRLGGIGVFVDWNLFGKLGAEGEARWLRLNQQLGSYEDNYLVGPRYSRHYGKFVPYAKFMLGAGELQFPSGQGHGGYFAMAPGGGLDYRFSRHITIRAIDYEYQFWPKAPGGGLPTNGLTPNGFSFGVGYRIF